MRKFTAVLYIALVFCIIASSYSYAAGKQSVGQNIKDFWQKLFSYPANVTNESVGVITEAAKGTTKVVTNEVKTVGQVTSGDLDKTKDLVTGPLAGTAETAKKAVEETAAIPVNANKEEPK